MFELDPKLENDTIFIVDLELSRLLLNNNKDFPWLMLVPRIENIKEMIDLNEEQNLLLNIEIRKMSKVMKSLYLNCKLNVAAIGNIVSQLHIHIIARHKEDVAWPGVAWGREVKHYSDLEKDQMIKKVKLKLEL